MKIRDLLTEAPLNPGTNYEILDLAAKHKYQLLGSGADATVFGSSTHRPKTVVKITSGELYTSAKDASSGFDAFYKFCQDYTDHPNLPKFTDKGFFLVNGEKIPYVRMERLEQHPPADYIFRIVNSIINEVEKDQIAGWNLMQQHIQIHHKKLSPRQLNMFREFYSLLRKLKAFYVKRSSKLRWDLHEQNVMYRGNIPIITDPFRGEGVYENIQSLQEEQRFDFDKHRDTILRFVQNTLQGKPNNRQFNPFYELIVGGGRVGAATKLGIDPKMAAAWKQYFQSKPFLGGAGEPWSQVNIGDQYAKATGDDRTLNFYVTVSKDKDNIIKFFRNYHSLASYLQPISQQNQTPIKFKTHSILDSFIGHNDSFKVYYYDPKLRDQIVATVKKWLSDSGISTAARSHEHGVDVKSGGGSFGQLLSNHVYDEFTKLIKTHGANVTPEKYFEWLKANLAVLIKQVKPTEQMTESWSKDYKKSIDCSKPKGFSQHAHCAGRKARKAGKKTKSSSISETTVKDIHKLADQQGVKWDNDDKFMAKTKELTGKEHLDDLTPAELLKVQAWLKSVNENFADGKKPGRKGLAKRSGVDCKQSASKLRKVAKNSTGEKQRMAHWCSNMKSGKKK